MMKLRRLAVCLVLGSVAVAQTGAWQPPIAAPPPAKTDDRTPPAWVASVRTEVAAAVTESLREALGPVVEALKAKAAERPASMPAPVVAPPQKDDRPVVSPAEPWWRSGEFFSALLAVMAAVAGWIVKRTGDANKKADEAHEKADVASKKADDAVDVADEAVPNAVAAVRADRGPPRKELAEAVAQQAAQGLPVAGTPVVPAGFKLVPISEVPS
jgi:hypothetical protein